MKIRTEITEIECSAEELRQSNTVADGFLNAMRHCFNGPLSYQTEEDQEEEDEQ